DRRLAQRGELGADHHAGRRAAGVAARGRLDPLGDGSGGPRRRPRPWTGDAARAPGPGRAGHRCRPRRRRHRRDRPAGLRGSDVQPDRAGADPRPVLPAHHRPVWSVLGGAGRLRRRRTARRHPSHRGPHRRGRRAPDALAPAHQLQEGEHMIPSDPSAPAIRLRGVSLGYDDALVVDELDLDVPLGGTTVLIGANGSGKTTLLRGLTRQLPLRSGSMSVLGRDTAGWSPREFARTVALLPQAPVAPEGMTVEQLVDRGRHPHRRLLGGRRADDTEAVAGALERTGMVEFAERRLTELSGGQRQRAWLALVLAQSAPVMLLDEPTSYLDLAHQLDLM